LPAHLIPLKIQDHQRTNDEFTQLVEGRLKALKSDSKLRNEFIAEMRWLLPAATVRGTLENPAHWDFLIRRCGSRHRWPSRHPSEVSITQHKTQPDPTRSPQKQFPGREMAFNDKTNFTAISIRDNNIKTLLKQLRTEVKWLRGSLQ
jgi:hypothetical protein